MTMDQPPVTIHRTAVITGDVELAEAVEIGPFCLLDGRIRIGSGTRLIGHVTILGDTEIGRDNVIHPNVVLGDEPQDLGYQGGPRRLRIGDRNVFREGVTIHRGSEQGGKRKGARKANRPSDSSFAVGVGRYSLFMSWIIGSSSFVFRSTASTMVRSSTPSAEAATAGMICRLSGKL